MGLFDIFKSGKNTAPSRDLVWYSRETAQKGCLDIIANEKPDLVAAWFDNTREAYDRFFKTKNLHTEIIIAKSLSPFSVANKTIMFLEHYPLFSVEDKLLTGTGMKKAVFISSLEDLIFRLFGGNISRVMTRLGMEEDQFIESSLVHRAIVNAQKRLEKKVTADFYAGSDGEWLKIYTTNFGRQ